jgi:hypothetical protein
VGRLETVKDIKDPVSKRNAGLSNLTDISYTVEERPFRAAFSTLSTTAFRPSGATGAKAHTRDRG